MPFGRLGRWCTLFVFSPLFLGLSVVWGLLCGLSWQILVCLQLEILLLLFVCLLFRLWFFRRLCLHYLQAWFLFHLSICPSGLFLCRVELFLLLPMLVGSLRFCLRFLSLLLVSLLFSRLLQWIVHWGCHLVPCFCFFVVFWWYGSFAWYVSCPLHCWLYFRLLRGFF